MFMALGDYTVLLHHQRAAIKKPTAVHTTPRIAYTNSSVQASALHSAVKHADTKLTALLSSNG